MMSNDSATKPHHGRNIKRIRELRGMKQDAMAFLLAERTGEKWDQSKISYLEGRETVETQLLEEVAKILEVPSDAIKNLPESQLPLAVFNPVFHEGSALGVFSTINFNNKVVELFERLLNSEKEKFDILRRQVENLTREIEDLKKKSK